MKTATIVIGSGFGDEGKGMTTLCVSNNIPTDFVVRYNGGAQAGHTIMVGDKRFVHSHYGSASVNGVQTIFESTAIANPYVAKMEAEEFHTTFPDIALKPILLHTKTEISTVYDMFFNQLESKGKFNTCGLGIFATKQRVKQSGVSININHNDDEIQVSFAAIASYYRDKICSLTCTPEEQAFFCVENVPKHADAFIKLLKDSGRYLPLTDELQRAEHVIYEGAQGLMLDEDLGVMPFLTPSKPGSLDALTSIIENSQAKPIVEILYVTRSFATRHGSGEFEVGIPFNEFNYSDETNKFNQHQGNFKVGKLNLDAVSDFIHRDLHRSRQLMHRVVPFVRMSVTHMDMFSHDIKAMVIKNGRELEVNGKQLLQKLPFKPVVLGIASNRYVKI